MSIQHVIQVSRWMESVVTCIQAPELERAATRIQPPELESAENRISRSPYSDATCVSRRIESAATIDDTQTLYKIMRKNGVRFPADINDT